MKPLHRLQQAKPAPKEDKPLPKIVMEALMGEPQQQEEILIGTKGTRIMSDNIAKKLLNNVRQ